MNGNHCKFYCGNGAASPLNEDSGSNYCCECFDKLEQCPGCGEWDKMRTEVDGVMYCWNICAPGASYCEFCFDHEDTREFELELELELERMDRYYYVYPRCANF